MVELIDGKIYWKGVHVATINQNAQEWYLSDFCFDLETSLDGTSYNQGYEDGYKDGLTHGESNIEEDKWEAGYEQGYWDAMNVDRE